MDLNADQPLLRPYDQDGITLPNRIIMAPLTRMRTNDLELVPTSLHAEYYAQRASAGLIISEGIFVSPAAVGWANVPGLWSEQQVGAWRKVTQAVHRAGGRIFAQLWHTGSMSHPDFFAGAQPIAPSAVNPLQRSVTASGHKDTVEPRAMSRAEISRTVKEFAHAARNAIDADFDGVQIQAGYLYLVNQFLNSRTNVRTDEYGGSTENRARFLFEILGAVVDTIGTTRVGIKTGPMTTETGAFVANDDTLRTANYVIDRLNDYRLSHLLLMGPVADLTNTPLASVAGDRVFRHFRRCYSGTIIANVGFDRESANAIIESGLADLVAFGRAFIANPDLPARFAAHAPLNEVNPDTIYDGGAAGYTDYPPLDSPNVESDPNVKALAATA
jgi:N-ethylmaleimide reductase